MNDRIQESRRKFIPIWCAIGGLLFVLGWAAIMLGFQYINQPVIVRELCAVKQFEQDISPNNANSRIVFCQDTEDGVGIYFCDTAGGKPKLLCEQKEKGRSWRYFTMLGWTPDDRLFACALPDNKQNEESVMIFNGQTGELLNKVVTDQGLDQFTWLSSDAFAYSVNHKSVRIVMKQSNGEWVHKRYFENVATNMNNFTAVSANTVAWRDDVGISSLDLNSGSSEKIWEAATNRLVELTYSLPASVALLNCSDDEGQYLVWLNLRDKHTFDLGRIGNRQNFIRKAVWDGRGSSYAYLTNDLAGSAFCIKTAEMATPITVPWQGGVRSFTLNGQKLFFSGNPDDHTPGIWEYDIKSQVFKCVVASTGDPFKYIIGTPPAHGVMTNSLGEQVFYHLWVPPNVKPNQKCPVLLAQELNFWFPYFPIAANSGFYVAVVDRPFFYTWEGEHEHTWVEDVSSLYRIMADNPNIDTTRVYLYANSTETFYSSQLINDHPTLTKGAILFSPTVLPELSTLQNKRFFIVDGKTDGDAIERLSKFRDRAAERGNVVTLFLQNDTGHIPASGTTEHDRAKQFTKFLSDDQ